MRLDASSLPIRALKQVGVLLAVAGVGLGLRWVTAGSATSVSTDDLESLAELTVAAIAWVAYTWLAAAVLATALEQAPGTIGRAAAAVATRITSQTSRALLRSALGVAAVTPLTLGVAHATPAAPTDPRPWLPTEPASSIRLTDTSSRPAKTTHQTTNATTWRATEPSSSISLTTPGPSTSRQAADTSSRAATRPQTPPPQHSRQAPPPRQAPRVPLPDRPTAGAPIRYTKLRPAASTPRTVTVRPGDSLWTIAAAELGPTATNAAIATRWPAWYEANRTAIGPDPDLLHPGQLLRSPTHLVRPTPQEN